MNKNNYTKGISLLETLIYVAIFSVFVVGITRFYMTLTSSRMRAQSILEVNGQGSRAIRFITQALRNGAGINSPSVGSSAASLSIATNTPATNPTVFYLNSGVLYVAEGSNPPVELTNNKVSVSNLNFYNLSNTPSVGSVQVELTITNTSGEGVYAIDFSGSASLRK